MEDARNEAEAEEGAEGRGRGSRGRIPCTGFITGR